MFSGQYCQLSLVVKIYISETKVSAVREKKIFKKQNSNYFSLSFDIILHSTPVQTKINPDMWLRSEKRNKRGRGDTLKSTSSSLRKIVKSVPTVKTLKGKSKTTTLPTTLTATLNVNRRQLHSTSVIESKSSNKCNKIKASVKRLGRRATTVTATSVTTTRKRDTTKNATDKQATIALTARNSRRKVCDSGKENCWQDTNQDSITLYTTDVNVKINQVPADVEINRNCNSIEGLSNDEALDHFGPIDVDASVSADNVNADEGAGAGTCKGSCVTCRTINQSTSICQIDQENNTRKLECTNFIKCISECDSTTDYDRIDSTINVASTSSSTVTAATNYYFKPLADVVVPEVDSTTDLISSVSTTNTCPLEEDATNANANRELPKLTIPTTINHSAAYQSNQNNDGGSCNRATPPLTSGMLCTASGSGLNTASTSNATTYPNTPDLISLFDEEINKGSGDLCQYSDFFPYNSVITQALLSCNDVNALCEQTDLTANLQPSDITFLSSMNQTAIDNLKALTNLQNHPTNFLSSITLPKATCTTTNTDALIHSASALPGTMMPMYAGQQMLMHPQDAIMLQQAELVDETGEIQLETDECMENEESQERQDDLTWDAFDPYLFIKHLPPLTPEMRAKCPALPLKTRSSPEFNLVLDLDETLVHCSLQELSDASFKFPVLFQVNYISEMILGTELSELLILFIYFVFNRTANIQYS